nr:TolC family protein [uncultured Duganella sp.]
MQYDVHVGVAVLILAMAAPAAARAGETPVGGSVDSLLRYAKEHNPEYASMQQDAAAAGERAAVAGALPDPKLRVELMDITMGGEQRPTLLPNRAGSTRYTLMQDVPWFGKRGLQRDIATLESDGAQARVAGSWAELSARLKAGYAQLYYVHQNANLTKEILDIAARLEAVAQARYAGGLGAQSDAIRAQVEQTSLRNELIALDSEKRTSQARLNMLLGRPADAALAPPEGLRALPAPARLAYADLAERVHARNPLLFADDARLRAAEKSRDLTYRNRYPDFTVGIAPVQYGRTVREWAVMVELNIPLQQGTRRGQEREADAMLSAARSRKQATSNQLLADLAETLSGLDAARRTEAAIAASLLPQADLTYRAALASYETGKVDFATLLDAQRQIRMAKQNQIKAQADAQARLADIERLLGEDL